MISLLASLILSPLGCCATGCPEPAVCPPGYNSACDGAVMHRDYGHHLIVEPKCRAI